jgi:riboflavin synthase
MFTGLVEALGELVASAPTGGGFRVRIATALAAELRPGDSLAVNGVCLTVVETKASEVYADVGPETLRVTTLGGLARGTLLNLERPMRADGRFGGHLVQGHVDAIGHIQAVRADESFRWVRVSFPAPLAPYLVPKGSIAVDGISLTVAELGTDSFDVMLVPHTVEHTNLKAARVRDAVNLEGDLIAKYVVRAAEIAGLALAPRRAENVTP